MGVRSSQFTLGNVCTAVTAESRACRVWGVAHPKAALKHPGGVGSVSNVGGLLRGSGQGAGATGTQGERQVRGQKQGAGLALGCRGQGALAAGVCCPRLGPLPTRGPLESPKPERKAVREGAVPPDRRAQGALAPTLERTAPPGGESCSPSHGTETRL